MSAQHQFYKEISLDSFNRRTGTLNRPVFTFNNSMASLDYIQVNRVIVPTTYYVFTAPLNTQLTINGTNVSWAAGNYTPAEWIAVVQPQIPSVTITYSNITNKLTFTHATNNITFSALFQSRLNLLLGIDFVNTGVTSYTAPRVVQFSGPNYLVLRARMASNFNDSSIFFHRRLTIPPIQDNFIMVPITENRNGVVFYENTNDQYFEWFDASTREMEFYFTLGDSTEEIDFNGASFQIKLTGYSYNPMTTDRLNTNQSFATR
jgi:hypothetical protein